MQDSKKLHHPCHIKVPESGRNPKSHITTPVAGSPERKGMKKATPLPSRGPQRRNCASALVTSGCKLWVPCNIACLFNIVNAL